MCVTYVLPKEWTTTANPPVVSLIQQYTDRAQAFVGKLMATALVLAKWWRPVASQQHGYPYSSYSAHTICKMKNKL